MDLYYLSKVKKRNKKAKHATKIVELSFGLSFGLYSKILFECYDISVDMQSTGFRTGSVDRLFAFWPNLQPIF